MNKTSIWIARLTALGFSVLIAVVLMDVFVRLLGRDKPLLWEPDARLGWRHIPNARLHWTEEGDGQVKINSLGLRDVERTVEKPSGVFRIAVFGDSTTEAIQVNLEQTFCQLLEKRLRDRGLRVEVVNFGVSGYGPLQSYLLYSQEGWRFSPDLVLHAVFTDNDVADGDRRLAAGQRGAPFLDRSNPSAFNIDYSAAEKSVVDYGREPIHTLRDVSALYRMLSAARSTRSNLAAIQTATSVSGQVPRRFLLYATPLASEWQEAWVTFERVVDTFADSVEARGTRYALLSMPAGQVVRPATWAELLEQYPAMAGRKWDARSAEDRLRGIAAQHEIPLIAPLGTFVRETSDEPLFFQQIGHLTPRGHRVMADVLEKALNDQGLLPR